MITIGPIIAITIIIILGLFYLQIEHHTRKIKIAATLAIIALIYFSITGVFSSDQVDMTSPTGIINAAYIYVGWLGSIATNLWDVGVETTHMVGNAIKVNTTEEEHKR